MSETSTGDAVVSAVKDVQSAAGNWRRAGIAGAAIGVVAAGAAAGVAMERLTVGRGMRRKARLALDATGPYGALRGMPGKAVADDGTVLYYESDEVEPEPGANGPRKRRLFGRKVPAPVTVVFSHGYCLSQDSWHFQRAALRGVLRTVHWDQRSHGRSDRGKAQRDGVPIDIDQLGRDLKAVIDAAAPEGPLVLVGHSMGGMTIMALADQYPELIRDRVVGVALRRYVVGQARRGQLRPPGGRGQRGAPGAAGHAQGAGLAGRAGGAGAAGDGRPVRGHDQAVLRSPPRTSTRRWPGSPSG